MFMKYFFGKREARMSYNRIYISNFWRKEFEDKCYCRMASYMSQNNEKINAIVVFKTKDNMERLNCMCLEFDGVGEYLTDTFEAKISYGYITVPKKYRELCQFENGKQFIQVGLGDCICCAVDLCKVDEEEVDNFIESLLND